MATIATEPDGPTRFERRTFGVLLGVAALLFLWTISPIWVPVFLGVLLAVVASPLQRRIERRHGRRRLLAAAITLVTVALGVAVVALVGFVVVRELLRYFTDVLPGQAAAAGQWLHSPRVARTLAHVGQTPAAITRQLEELARATVQHLTGVVGGVLALTSTGLLTIVFTTITSYYLLLEGPALARFALRMVPLPQTETRALMREFHQVAIGTLLGLGVIAIVQGVLAGLGFWVGGVTRPIVWATLTTMASLLPLVGTAIVCVPVAIARILTGHAISGVALLVYWAVVVVALPDYWLRPRLMAGHMRLHSLLVLIGVFGGVEAFGAIGVLLGPIFVAMFVTLLRIYERDYRRPA